MHQLVKKVFLPSWWRESKLSTIRNGRFAALAELACGPPLLIGLTSRCFVPQFAIVALLRYRLQVSFAHWTSASPVSRTARGEAPSHWARASCAPPATATSTIRNGRLAAPDGLQYFLAHWAYYGLFRAPRAAFVRPYQFPLKSYGFPGAETAKKRFLLWKMGFSGAVYCEPMHPSIQHGRSTALASSLAVLPASLGLLRAVSPTGRALRAPPPYTPPGTIEAREGLGPSRALPWDFLTVWVIIFPGEGT